MTAPPKAERVLEPRRYTAATRILHWLVAISVFATLLLGFTMVNSLANYRILRDYHVILGMLVLLLMVLRVLNRLRQVRNRRRLWPPLPDTVGRAERWMVLGSELTMYTLLVAQPLVGWAMVSASGVAPVDDAVNSGGTQDPLAVRIAPFNDHLYFVLRQTHSVLAYALVVVIAAHVSAVLLHTLTLRDGMFSRMGFGRSVPKPVETD